MKDKTEKRPRRSKAEQECLDLIDQWENTPAENPFYEGKTPLEVARALLKPKER